MQAEHDAKSTRICLFGGSFDPVHNGHIMIASEVQRQLELDHVIFIPCLRSPHKEKDTGADGKTRARMLEAATQHLKWATVDHIELERDLPSYSWMTAETYKERFPEAELFWLIGTDQWNTLSHWARHDYFASLVRFIVFTRGAEPLAEHDGIDRITISGNHPASSTQIRHFFQTQQPSNDAKEMTWLAPEVIQIIQKEKLYY